MSGSFIAIPSMDLGKPRVSDRTSDLKSVIINNGDISSGIHVDDPELAREWAGAFTKAAELLEAMGPAKYCAACGAELPGHSDKCPRRPS